MDKTLKTDNDSCIDEVKDYSSSENYSSTKNESFFAEDYINETKLFEGCYFRPDEFINF